MLDMELAMNQQENRAAARSTNQEQFLDEWILSIVRYWGGLLIGGCNGVLHVEPKPE